MKKRLYFLIGISILTGICSCQKDFLQKPDTTGNTTIETVFSTTVNAQAAIANAYRECLSMGLSQGHGTLAALSGELSRGYSWHEVYNIINSGMSASGNREDDFNSNYTNIRKAYLVMENIDKVSDMDASTKQYVKGEMAGLIAYRYMGMFIRYGGVPLVSKSLTSSDDLNISRASLQETLDFIVTKCDEASAALPDKWPDNFYGRLTKGVALAIKARSLTYAARPLFNSATPYLSAGENNNLICFGSADQQRWQNAITANEAVLGWAAQNGYAIINTAGGTGIKNANAFADYATATSTPANKEVLLAYKLNENNNIWKYYNISTYGNNIDGAGYDMDNYGMESNFLSNYYKADGTDQNWPMPGDAVRPYSDYNTRMKELEPRFLADNFAHGIDPLNNPGDQGWSALNADRGVNQGGSYGKGVANSVKYYYQAGSRTWFEYPLFRMPEIYLSLAEAYNEVGNQAKALENLNIVHNRAGLPSIFETDQVNLRKIIQREWSVEFYNENHRYFDAKHWKLDDIGNGIIGGPRREFQFTTNGQSDRLAQNLLTYYDQVVFQAYWAPKMFLDPFPQDEINKGVLTQNPGY